jgi:hypothetical protein
MSATSWRRVVKSQHYRVMLEMVMQTAMVEFFTVE